MSVPEDNAKTLRLENNLGKSRVYEIDFRIIKTARNVTAKIKQNKWQRDKVFWQTNYKSRYRRQH